MSPCGRARRHTSRGAMAVLAWKFPRTRLPVGASALCVVVLCWLYVFPVYRLPDEKEIVQGVLQQGTAWRRNRTAAGDSPSELAACRRVRLSASLGHAQGFEYIHFGGGGLLFIVFILLFASTSGGTRAGEGGSFSSRASRI
uniref:Alpha-N-acetylneuraminide alpha-2,8-sialyltransferase n=1 Tax=Bos mutus grunniens TaxID=30521 RepID=A0A8B9WJR9_BOSMU